eukprot:CAMPEP_0114541856 /NCGR_PEP_ID=MMETSP0114-20121206/1528_1 /TAXON_ID=31324 /ORGANISM="Goniomonas sp, Strain m" /LENGTH=155 /DNA_ID=CAMNT_0001726121 /DNA_START=9 /DNA_END=476 /DNA_ORIENTATION=-
MEKASKTFEKFDMNKSGNIDCHELQAALKSMGTHVSELQTKELLDEWDADYDGQMSFSEYLNLVEAATAGDQDEIQDMLDAWTAHGGAKGGTGTVDVSKIRRTIHTFELELDLDLLLLDISAAQAVQSATATTPTAASQRLNIDFQTFQELFRPS